MWYVYDLSFWTQFIFAVGQYWLVESACLEIYVMLLAMKQQVRNWRGRLRMWLSTRIYHAEGLIPSTPTQTLRNRGLQRKPASVSWLVVARQYLLWSLHSQNFAKYRLSWRHTHWTHFLAKGCIDNSLEDILLGKHKHTNHSYMGFLVSPLHQLYFICWLAFLCSILAYGKMRSLVLRLEV